MSASSAQSPIVEQLRRQLLRSQPAATDHTVVSSGFPSLDRLLPQSGLPTGSLMEWISGGAGMRTTTIALKVGAQLLHRPGAFAVVDPLNCFSPVSLEQSGIPLSRLLLIRPTVIDGNCATACYDTADQLSSSQRSEALWALEQVARCAGVTVVLMWIDRLSSTAQRRLQLAVEKSGTTVFLMRPPEALRQTSWADLRFQVQSCRESTGKAEMETGSRVTVSLIRSRNSVQRHGVALLECHHETGDVFEIPKLADSAAAEAVAV